ncbi:MAG TPA: RidA family protein, partial [Ottowia sp.]|nr:RidA family protein [Ottowia sp.]
VSPAHRRATARPEGKATVQRIDIGVAHRVGIDSDAALLAPGARVLLISGTPGLDGDSGQLPASFEAQAELAWQNVTRILAAADMGIEDIAKVTHHHRVRLAFAVRHANSSDDQSQHRGVTASN